MTRRKKVAPMFAAEIAEIHAAVMWVDNSQWEPNKNDPREMDPDDEPLASMRGAASSLRDAAEALREAVSDEIRRRSEALDNMSDEEYEAWEKGVA
jgi:hypothetical protein